MKTKNITIRAALLPFCLFTLLLLTSCGDGSVDLPAIGVETDLYNIPLETNDSDLLIPLKDESVPMVHNGALHTDEDFARAKANLNNSPWKETYARLTANSHAQLTYVPNPQDKIVRGTNSEYSQNYQVAFNDVAAAYQLTLRWRLEDNDAYADKAVEILNGWAKTCTLITGSTDQYLAAGIYGYQFAVTGELLRNYSGWNATDFKAYQDWMVNLWYAKNHDFLIRHNGTPAGHYWANWGLANIASMTAIGILADRRDIYNEAIEHFQTGETNGNINKAIYHVFDGEWSNFAQWQEDNRDQGHTYLCQGLMGIIMQLTWNQGDDFFSYKDNMFLKACEYTAAYDYANIDVPNISYTRTYLGNWGVATEEYPTISDRMQSDVPVWSIPYYHYSKVSNVDPARYQYTEMVAKATTPEGGGGDYGSNSGGYDNLGFGSLMYAR